MIWFVAQLLNVPAKQTSSCLGEFDAHNIVILMSALCFSMGLLTCVSRMNMSLRMDASLESIVDFSLRRVYKPSCLTSFSELEMVLMVPV